MPVVDSVKVPKLVSCEKLHGVVRKYGEGRQIHKLLVDSQNGRRCFIYDDGRYDYMLRAFQEPANLKELAMLRGKLDVALGHAQKSDRECGAAVQRLQVETEKLKKTEKELEAEKAASERKEKELEAGKAALKKLKTIESWMLREKPVSVLRSKCLSWRIGYIGWRNQQMMSKPQRVMRRKTSETSLPSVSSKWEVLRCVRVGRREV